MLMVYTTQEKRKKVCDGCRKTFNAGDAYIEEATSSYMGNITKRWNHLSCFKKANWRYFPESFSKQELREFAKKEMFEEKEEGDKYEM